MREKFYEQIEGYIELREEFKSEGNYEMAAHEMIVVEARADLAKVLGIITVEEYRDIIRRVGLIQ